MLPHFLPLAFVRTASNTRRYPVFQWRRNIVWLQAARQRIPKCISITLGHFSISPSHHQIWDQREARNDCQVWSIH